MEESSKRVRPAIMRSRRGRLRLIVFAILALTLVGAGVFLVRLVALSREPLDCAAAYSASTAGDAIVVCQREYEQSKQPQAGINLADLLRRNKDSVAAASAIANDLLSSDLRGDALQILGKI